MSPKHAQYDAVIIGGGPAGCAAAITIKSASPSANVLLLEKGSYPRHKVCGEFVSPEAVELLKRLAGSASCAEIERAPRISKASLMVGERAIQVPLNPPAISLPRYQLDALLWAAAHRVGVECAGNLAAQKVRGDAPFYVEAGGAEVEARVVINTSGRWSNLSLREAPASGKKWLGLKAHFAERSPRASVDLYFFSGGYCGVQAVDDSSVNVCAMVRADIARDLSAVFEQHPALHRRSRSWRPVTETLATAPLIFQSPHGIEGRVVRAGDAAGFIDPFLGDGISLALRSGAIAGTIVAEFCQGNLSFEGALATYQSDYRKHLAPAFSRAAGLRRILDLPALLRSPLIGMARLPGMAEFIFRKTRHLSSPAR